MVFIDISTYIYNKNSTDDCIEILKSSDNSTYGICN